MNPPGTMNQNDSRQRAGLRTERGAGSAWTEHKAGSARAECILDRALRQGLGALIRGKAGGRFFEDIIKDVAHLVALDRAVA